MAGVNLGESGSGRRRSLDAEVNLVPFIDLLSMCISFLLLTAVWIAVGAVQIKQSHGTDAAVPKSEQYDIHVKFTSASNLQLELKRGKTVKKRVLEASNAQALLEKLDLSLTEWNETKNPAQVSAVRFRSKSSLTYGDLVNVMDVFRRHQIVNLAVLSGEAS